MGIRSVILTKALLNYFHPGKVNSFIPFSPNDLHPLLQNLPLPSNTVTLEELCPSPDSLLHTIHYSWFIDLFKNYPPPLQEVLVNVLSSEDQKKILKILNLKGAIPSPSFLFQTYLKKNLCSHFYKDPNLVPLSFLSPSELSPLMNLVKKECVTLIDLLAIYDLAPEVPTIVEKEKLKFINTVLSKDQQSFLRTCLKKPSNLIPKGKPILSGANTPEKLHYTLHLRGLTRLAFALKGEGSSFIWHFTHKLDSGRGTKLLTFIDKASEVKDQLQHTARQQVLNIIHLYFSVKGEL